MEKYEELIRKLKFLPTEIPLVQVDKKSQFFSPGNFYLEFFEDPKRHIWLCIQPSKWALIRVVEAWDQILIRGRKAIDIVNYPVPVGPEGKKGSLRYLGVPESFCCKICQVCSTPDKHYQICHKLLTASEFLAHGKIRDHTVKEESSRYAVISNIEASFEVY